MKLSTHGLLLNFWFVSMSIAEFLPIHIRVVTLKVTSYKTMSEQKNWKKYKIQDSIGKTNFATLL